MADAATRTRGRRGKEDKSGSSVRLGTARDRSRRDRAPGPASVQLVARADSVRARRDQVLRRAEWALYLFDRQVSSFSLVSDISDWQKRIQGTRPCGASKLLALADADCPSCAQASCLRHKVELSTFRVLCSPAVLRSVP